MIDVNLKNDLMDVEGRIEEVSVEVESIMAILYYRIKYRYKLEDVYIKEYLNNIVDNAIKSAKEMEELMEAENVD